MKLIFSFLPWILYGILTSYARIEFAVIASLAAACICELTSLKKGFILAWGTLLFFLLLLCLVFFKPQSLPLSHPSLFSNGALAIIALASLAAKKPFTLQYAREQVSKEFWESPVFIRCNWILTWIWALCLCASTAGSILYLYAAIGNSTYQTLLWAPFVVAIIFTRRFPNYYKQHKIDQIIERHEKAQATNPHLQGNFAPVSRELDVTDLPLIGELPQDLVGIYMRNGPNPFFPPFSYTYPLDGDGMLHAIYIRDGKASYRNRFIETDQLRAEKRAGKALYGSVDCPFIRDEKLLLPEDPKYPVKFGRFIHIIRHANQYIAFHEAISAYEVDAQLATIGEWNPTRSSKPIAVNPHPRLDPVTGELYLISYHIHRPVITYHVLNRSGSLIHEGEIEVPHCYIHDFVLTKNYFILFLCPVEIDLAARIKGGHLFNWKPEMGTQIVLVSRQNPSHPPIRITCEPFFNYHFANAYELDGKIDIDYVRYSQFSLSTEDIGSGHLWRTTIDLQNRRCSHKQIDDRSIEFPRINDHVNSHAYRYVYTPSNLKNDGPFNDLIKYDLHTGKTETHHFGAGYEIGEAVFVATPKAKDEDDGYLMLFASHRSENYQTEFFLLDAKNIADKPICRIPLPQRVPHGLHGSWMPGPW